MSQSANVDKTYEFIKQVLTLYCRLIEYFYFYFYFTRDSCVLDI